MKILLVDDEPAMRELLRATFEGADVVVDEAGSVAEANERIGLGLPDLVVLDLRLSGESGADLALRLKERPRTRDIPIVLLTGADPEDVQDVQADAIVHKPFSPLELLAVVGRLAGRDLATPVRDAAAGPTEELLLYARDLQHLVRVERRQRERLALSYRETVSALAGALEARDIGTRAHSSRVQRYAIELLETIDPHRLDEDPGIEFGFLLHDIGKLGIPDAILQKPGPLTLAERARMQTHTVIGARILGNVAALDGEGLHVVRSHHERWDGLGYPDGRAGYEVPLSARVFAVADTLDAMTSARPYRSALAWGDARAEIIAQSGKQFDPDVVDAFRERELVLQAARESAAVA